MKYCTVCSTKYEDAVSFCPRDGEVLEDDPSSLVGQTLDGQYQIEALLGRGGMGAVYSARHILLGDKVAIKVLPPQMRNNAEWLRRFRREGQAARRFRHPNAVTVYDLRTTADGLIYMVMEFVEGHTLDAELKQRGRFSPLEAMSVLEPVMSVLNAAHAMGVVHRDLKPENIMLGKSAETPRPVVKLLDLGIAKMREVAGTNTGGATALTIAGQILGTPYYMSPEQWGEVPQDGDAEIDGRADIYSLGTVFYELVAGKKPFNANTLQELRRQHVSITPPALQDFLPDVPEAFSLIIVRAMAKDRGERPATAGELDAALRAALGLPPADISTLSFAQTGGGSLPESLTPARSGAGGAVESHKSGTAGPEIEGATDARGTNSDLSAPTILTVDQEPWDETSAKTSTASGTRSPQAPETLTLQSLDAAQEGLSTVNSQAGTGAQASAGAQPDGAQMQTIATHPPASHAAFNSNAAFNSQAASAPSGSASASAHGGASAAAAPRRSPVPVIIACALVLLLVVGGLGGWLVYRRMKDNAGSNQNNDGGGAGKIATANDNSGAVSSNSAGPTEAAGAAEMMRYWLDVEQQKGTPLRLAGELTLHSGQRFKFHFMPREDGYLYIVGPGQKSVPTTFLTAQPITAYAKTNEVKGGADFTFPNGSGQWLEEDKTTGTENYTIIFSKTPLSAPGFLNALAGSPLTSAQQAELAEFRSQHKANSPVTAVNQEGGNEPFVSVKMSGQAAANHPAILEVRIEHQ